MHRPSRRARFAGAAAVMIAAAALLHAACRGAEGPPPPPPGAIASGTSVGTAAIAGRARFEGTPPPRRPIKMSGESACVRSHDPALSEDLIVGSGGGLKNVYARVVSGLGDRVFAPPAEPAVMDQAGCLFIPHVLAVQANRPILFKNSDPAAHNVRAVATKNRGFNVSMSGKGRTVTRWFTDPEMVRIRCDIHSWMGAFIGVEAHPFAAVTSDDGAFSLAGLPAGTYEIEAWHETLGTKRASVTVADGETAGVEFTFAR